MQRWMGHRDYMPVSSTDQRLVGGGALGPQQQTLPSTSWTKLCTPRHDGRMQLDSGRGRRVERKGQLKCERW